MTNGSKSVTKKGRKTKTPSEHPLRYYQDLARKDGYSFHQQKDGLTKRINEDKREKSKSKKEKEDKKKLREKTKKQKEAEKAKRRKERAKKSREKKKASKKPKKEKITKKTKQENDVVTVTALAIQPVATVTNTAPPKRENNELTSVMSTISLTSLTDEEFHSLTDEQKLDYRVVLDRRVLKK